MALAFNSQQLKIISDEYLAIATDIQSATDSKAAMAAEKERIKSDDDKNKVFYSHYLNLITQYHKEIESLVGVKKTTYSDSNLIPSAKILPDSAHFPQSPLWNFLLPKMVDSNNGNPTTQNATHERSDNAIAREVIDLFLNGFNDGVITTSGTSGVTGNEIYLSSSGIDVNDRIIVSGTTGSFIGQVSNKVAAGSNTKYTFTFLYPTTPVSLTGNVNAYNFWSGFSNSERESFTSATYQMVMNAISTKISTYVDLCSGWLSNQLDALKLNDADGAEKKEIADAKSNVSRSLSVNSNWKSSPNTGTGVGKWGNSKIVPLKTDLEYRLKDIGVRYGQIIYRLGSVAQSSTDGSFSGSGNYLNFFKWLDFRLNKATGTLTGYYASDMGTGFFDQKIASLQRKEAELKQKFVIVSFAENPVGSSVKMKSVKGFVVGDSVFLAAKDVDLVKAKILSIGADNVMKFDSIIAESFSVDSGGRVIKQM